MAKSKSKNTKNYAVPGKPMTQKEFKGLIEEAEKGPFIGVDELRKSFETWRKKHSK
jgi:hypothetical protein